MVKGVFKFISILLILFVVMSGVFAFVAIDDTPCIAQERQASVGDALRTRRLADRLLWRLMNSTDTAVVYAMEEELNSVMIFISRGLKRISGQVNVNPGSIDATACFRIPRSPLGRYINMNIRISPSQKGLNIAEVSVGKMVIPGRAALSITRFMLNLFMGDDGGTVLINSVKSMSIKKNMVVLSFHSVPELKLRVAKVKERWKFVRDRASFFGEPVDIRVYYEKLIDIDRNMPAGPVSLDKFMKPLFQLARDRGGDTVKENEAALLALSILFGSHRIESFTGTVRSDELRSYRIRHLQVFLGNRNDLRLHFLVSAALKIISDSGITYAIGEFKELADAGRGGSGFSFADLAADRAGVRFAETAVESPGSARWIQSIMTGELSEEMFFPDISGLPEGLSKDVFDKYYSNVASNEYRALVEAIDRCIDRLPAYRRKQVMKEETEMIGCNVSSLIPKTLNTAGR